MERGEPTFVPQWYKSSAGSASSSSGGSTLIRHCRSSSNSDERDSWLLPRNRPTTSGSNNDRYRTTSFDSLRRSASTNGSMSHGKNVSATQIRPFSSFGRSHLDGERGKDPEFHDRSRPRVLENGFTESHKSSRTETGTLRRSRSPVSGKLVDSRIIKAGKDVNNGVHSGGILGTGIGKASFDRNFPSLGAENAKGRDLSRISSGPKTAIQSLPIGASALVGGNGWTSPLAEIPSGVGSNGSVPCPSVPRTPKSLPSTGLNMAETLAQPPQARNTSQLSVDTRRADELARIQSTKLIPVMPSMSRSSILSSSDKSKSKAVKGVDICGLHKSWQQSSSQLVRHTTVPPARSTALRTPQAPNSQVPSTERNGILPVAKDGPNLINTTKVVGLMNQVPSGPLKISTSPMTKADSKVDIASSSLIPSGEKRPSQAQRRTDFFNTLRKNSSGNHSATEPNCITPTNSAEPCEQSDVSSFSNQEDKSLKIPGFDSSIVMDNDASRVGISQEPLELGDDMNEDEIAFLESLGWDKDAEVEVLTPEEIDAFVKEHGPVRQSPNLSHRDLLEMDATSSGNSKEDV